MSKTTTLSICLGSLLVATAANADHRSTNHSHQSNGQTELLVEGAIEFGGDDLTTVVFTNGDNETIRAGDGISLHAGFKHKFNAGQSMLKGTIGYKFDTTSADNSDVGTSSLLMRAASGSDLTSRFSKRRYERMPTIGLLRR